MSIPHINLCVGLLPNRPELREIKKRPRLTTNTAKRSLKDLITYFATISDADPAQTSSWVFVSANMLYRSLFEFLLFDFFIDFRYFLFCHHSLLLKNYPQLSALANFCQSRNWVRNFILNSKF